MIRIGICDDFDIFVEELQRVCEEYFQQCQEEHEYTLFSTGEEVLEYCKNGKKPPLDLLFLDIELPGISGIEVKKYIQKSRQVWRIVFVTSYSHYVKDAFGTKVIGFIDKPPKVKDVGKKIKAVLDEKRDNVLVEIKEPNLSVSLHIPIEEILYIKAEGNYTKVFLNDYVNGEIKHILCSQKLNQWEEDMADFPFIRIHKSYMVNLINCYLTKQQAIFFTVDENITIGRFYQKKALQEFQEYVQKKLLSREV